MHYVEGSQPYPWPYDGSFVPSRCALVVTGAQRGWAEASCNADGISRLIGLLGTALTKRGGTVIVMLHHQASPRHRPCRFPPITHTNDSVPLDLHCEALAIDAYGIDGFASSSLEVQLRAADINTIVFAGFGAEATVDSTLRSANDRGYECLTLHDAVAPFDEVLEDHVLSSVTMSGGIFGAVAAAGDFLVLLEMFPVVDGTNLLDQARIQGAQQQ